MQVQEIQPNQVVRYTDPATGDTHDAIVKQHWNDDTVLIQYTVTRTIPVAPKTLSIPR